MARTFSRRHVAAINSMTLGIHEKRMFSFSSKPQHLSGTCFFKNDISEDQIWMKINQNQRRLAWTIIVYCRRYSDISKRLTSESYI